MAKSPKPQRKNTSRPTGKPMTKWYKNPETKTEKAAGDTAPMKPLNAGPGFVKKGGPASAKAKAKANTTPAQKAKYKSMQGTIKEANDSLKKGK